MVMAPFLFLILIHLFQLVFQMVLIILFSITLAIILLHLLLVRELCHWFRLIMPHQLLPL